MCAVGHANGRCTRIFGELKVVRGVADHHGVSGGHAGFVEQCVQHAGMGLGEAFIPATRCDETGMTAADTVMIGDTTHDLQLAENAGTAAIGVTYGAHHRELLHGHRKLTLVDSVFALRDYLEMHA